MAAPLYPRVRVKLTGTDGNAFAIIGKVTAALREAGVSAPEQHRFRDEAMSGDYGHLLRVCMEWVDVR